MLAPLLLNLQPALRVSWIEIEQGELAPRLRVHWLEVQVGTVAQARARLSGARLADAMSYPRRVLPPSTTRPTTATHRRIN